MYVCCDNFEDDCFDSFSMLQFTLTYLDKPIKDTRNRPREISAKFPHKLLKKRHFPKQREETHRKKEVYFSYSSENIN